MALASRILGSHATLLAVAAVLSCSSTPVPVTTMPATGELQASEEYRIQYGDVLDVKLFYKPDLNERAQVRPDGRISLQLIGEVRAAGQTPAELSAEIARRYAEFLTHPETTVIVRSFEGQMAYIDGEVRSPGLVRFQRPPSLHQAVVLAGGLKRSAATDQIIVIRDSGEDRPAVEVIDLEAQLQSPGRSAPFYLRSYDVVYVPKSRIAEVNDWVDQYIDEVIPQAVQSIVGFDFLYHVNDSLDVR